MASCSQTSRAEPSGSLSITTISTASGLCPANSSASSPRTTRSSPSGLRKVAMQIDTLILKPSFRARHRASAQRPPDDPDDLLEIRATKVDTEVGGGGAEGPWRVHDDAIDHELDV